MSSEGIPANPKLWTSTVLRWIAERKNPVSVHDLSNEFGISTNDAAQRLRKLHRTGAIAPIKSDDQVASACAARIAQERRKRCGKRKCGRAAIFYVIANSAKAELALSDRKNPVAPISDGSST